MNILIVDDKEEGRYLLEALLRENGHRVTAVTNGAEAIERLKSGGFELIISDILMPVMDGFQLCRKVKTDKALRRIPFIIYTATYTDSQDEAYALKIGADRFILKPCEPEVFLAAIEETMAASGRRDIASLPTLKRERQTFKLYSERLVKKLEDKMIQLEREVQVRRKAEETLQLEKTQSETIINLAPNIVVGLGKRSKILIFNKFAEKLTGFSAEEVIGKPWLEIFIPEEMRRQLYSVWDQIVENKLIEHHYENPIVTKQGEVRIISWNNTVLTKDGEFRMVLSIGEDITELKNAEKTLLESEEKFSAAFNFSPIALGIVTLDGKYVESNQAHNDIIGYPREEIIGKTATELGLLSMEDREKRGAVIESGGGQVRNAEVKLRVRDGSLRDFLFSIQPITLHGVTHRIFTGIDVTERKRAEETLRKSEEAYRNLVETARDVIFTVYPDGTLASLNPAFHAITGWSVVDWVGKLFSLILHPDDLPLAMEKFNRALQGELNEVFELRISTRLGGYVVGEFIIAPQIHNEKVVNILGIARDITERKRAEEALKESEGRLKELFDNAPVGYHEYDVNGSITRINQTELEMLGYRLEEIIGRPVWSFIVEEEESKQAVLRKLTGAFPSGRQFERTYHRKDGTTFPALVEDRLLYDSEGKVVAIRSTIEDISERKKLEEEMVSLQEQLRQSQKMEAIGRLAGGIAHDFNNLLTVIKGNSQLSLLDLREGDPLKTNIEEIRTASERASDLIKQLLAFSRKQIMEMQVIDLNLILMKLDPMLHRVLGEDIELATILTEGIGKIKADPGQIEQVIVNLAVNSRDAMPDGGKLTIETANVKLDEEYGRKHIAVKPGQYVMLSVSDTGMGMTKEVQERVFEPFFTTKGIGKGTGLGLSTVYGIVKQSGGNIWVYSEAGKGTAFKIYLPQVDEPLTELKEVVSKGIPRGDETILIVEDEETVRKLAVRILKSLGYRIFEAPEGGSALILCEEFKEPIHLILTDVVMPGMSGRTLVERLKKIHQEMEVIYMSGYTDNAILHHGVLEEGTNFIQKPFTLENLARKVREVLDKNKDASHLLR